LIAEQICDFLKRDESQLGELPSVPGELLPLLKPFLTLAERLGAFHGQLLRNPVRELKVDYFARSGNSPRPRHHDLGAEGARCSTRPRR